MALLALALHQILLREAAPLDAAYLAAILGLLGKKALEKAKPAPSRAISEAQQTIATLKS